MDFYGDCDEGDKLLGLFDRDFRGFLWQIAGALGRRF